VTDLERARRFYVEKLGFVVTESTKEQLFLRGIEDRYHHSLLLTLSESPGLGHIAFRVRDSADLKSLAELFTRKGLKTFWVDTEIGLGTSLRVQDQFGFPVEFYSEMKSEEWMLQRFDQQRGAKVLRLDHFNLLTPRVDEIFEWYSNYLNFTCTELTETEDEPPRLWAAWLRRKPTCHDVALTNGRGPRLHHAGFTVSDRSCIMDCADILASSGYVRSLERGPGRHGISNAFFLYLRDPDGNRVELYTGDYLSAEPDWMPIRWKLNDPQRQTFWGAPAPASWFNEAMLVKSFESTGFMPLSDPKMADRPQYMAEVR
jgi:catechol 2,3-dioxygenase